MKSTDKAPAINRLLDSLIPGPGTRDGSIRNGKCVFCPTTGLSEDSFRDDVSRKEYTISGLCQDCQDKVFSEGDEDDDDPIQQ